MNKLRELMDKRAWTATLLARVSGLSYPTCREAYKADHWPADTNSWNTILAIARALDVAAADLLGQVSPRAFLAEQHPDVLAEFDRQRLARETELEINTWLMFKFPSFWKEWAA